MGSSIRMIATLTVLPDSKDNIRTALHKMVSATQAEAGCLQYDCYDIAAEGLPGVTSTGGDFVVIEHWRDEAALQSHNESDHFQAFVSAFKAEELRLSVQVLKQA
ncbi:putative quinol monooxygenase [Oceanimonas sp. MB9]|uniref:putative quinol monooxygenase n=1 Tax=Oceanimonas sp. MB9 TaxID=2588453 RepID=UPI0013F635B6|nr:putative quinol monooxygenase [Oceanimonas sp. MB9]NHI00259.1 putative monooxygenase YcnE [Oceanimonas sp. MB9]